MEFPPEERQRIYAEEETRDIIAGFLLHPWLPWGMGRKLIMLGILAIAVFGVVYSGSLYWLLLLLVLPTFSPRAMGETFRFIGRLRR